MASINDSSLVFFSNATPAQWSFVLNLYRDVFRTHAEKTRSSRKNGPADLIKLDTWFQDQLPQVIRSRKEHQLFYEELVQITKWKLFRGKFRPSLLDLVKTNTENAVKNVTKKAFRKLPNISAAINALKQLKGIGPATASAILVAYSPDVCPYMAEETMISIVEVNDCIYYTIDEYLNYVEKIGQCVDKLKRQDADGDWTPHKIELALWTHYQIKQYNLNLLENMPSASEVVSNSSNQLVNETECDQISNSDENQVDSSLNLESEIELNCDSNIDTSNSNLIDSNNSTNNDQSSQNHSSYNSNNGVVDVSQSDNECNNELTSSSSKHHDKNVTTNVESIESNVDSNIVSNSEFNLAHEDSNLSSVISSNSFEESIQSNKPVSVEDDSSSNNVSSTNVNGISQSTSRHDYKLLNNRITNGKESSSTTNDEQINSDHQINSSIIKQHLNVQLTNTNQDNVDSNQSLPVTTESSISSSCENSNNVNSSEDSILQSNHKKRSNSSSSSVSNVTKQSRCLNNCNEALVNLDDNAVPDSESLSKRQKLI